MTVYINTSKGHFGDSMKGSAIHVVPKASALGGHPRSLCGKEPIRTRLVHKLIGEKGFMCSKCQSIAETKAWLDIFPGDIW